jgi:hypothetical protein
VRWQDWLPRAYFSVEDLDPAVVLNAPAWESALLLSKPHLTQEIRSG